MADILNKSLLQQRDTPFASLMQQRIYNVLLIASPYDAFMLEEDGRVDEQIYNEYNALGLRYSPRFTTVHNVEEALEILAERRHELLIVMPRRDGSDAFAAAARLKEAHPDTPVVVLTPFSKEVSRTLAEIRLRDNIQERWDDYVFAWLGNPDLLVAIIKLVEDRMNAPHDTAAVGVQTILLVEDSVRFYSSALPTLYRIVLEQSQEFSKEALNDHLRMLRMRGRPKVMLARTYEEAMAVYDQYRDSLLGVITDMSFEREGVKDVQAGAAFVKELRRYDPHLPVLIASSDAENRTVAQRLGVHFLEKDPKTFPHELREALLRDFGFGPFRIRDPRTGRVVLSINTLQELLHALRRIPDAALGYHLSRNDFSRFFYSRAMFPPAEILKNTHVSEYSSPDAARDFIRHVIEGYRRVKNEGVVAIYQRDRFDEFAKFTRIGSGSLGGKGRGLAFLASLLRDHLPPASLGDMRLAVPNTVILCTDIFDDFLAQPVPNGECQALRFQKPSPQGAATQESAVLKAADDGARASLYDLAVSETATDEQILQAFLAAPLPARIIDDLKAFLRQMKGCPIAVRSSSLLEDSHYQPFAGVYKTVMLPPEADAEVHFARLCNAVKEVYASVFSTESKRYLTATQNLIDEEKMAIVLQEVVVDPSLPVLAPTFSGVARSLNFYPPEGMPRESGVCELALGLGAYVVDCKGPLCTLCGFAHSQAPSADGEDASRPKAPALPRRQAARGYQRSLLAVNPTYATEQPLLSVPVSRLDARSLPPFVMSTFRLADGTLLPGIHTEAGSGGRVRHVPTFWGFTESVTADAATSLAAQWHEALTWLLRLGEHGMGRPVEIEFAAHVVQPERDAAAARRRQAGANAPATPRINLAILQIRPMVNPISLSHRTDADLHAATPEAEQILCSHNALGCDLLRTDVQDVLYVAPEGFSALDNVQRAAQIRELTQQLDATRRPYLLVAPGRWGSSDPSLGIPVRWADIAGTVGIVEYALKGYGVEMSQGSHFFQNLTSAGVPYISVDGSPASRDVLCHDLLRAAAERVDDLGGVLHLRLRQPHTLAVDGRGGIARFFQTPSATR